MCRWLPSRLKLQVQATQLNSAMVMKAMKARVMKAMQGRTNMKAMKATKGRTNKARVMKPMKFFDYFHNDDD